MYRKYCRLQKYRAIEGRLLMLDLKGQLLISAHLWYTPFLTEPFGYIVVAAQNISSQNNDGRLRGDYSWTRTTTGQTLICWFSADSPSFSGHPAQTDFGSKLDTKSVSVCSQELAQVFRRYLGLYSRGMRKGMISVSAMPAQLKVADRAL